MRLEDIYSPIKKELRDVELLLKRSLNNSGYKSISRISSYLLDSKGKRLRPALVILSAKAAQQSSSLDEKAMISLATAVEFVHIASLIHDDVIDHATTRHNKPSINEKYGEDVSIAAGDYLYSQAFELIANCGNLDILSCLAQATRLMCEGQLVQVCERDNLDLLKSSYIIFVKKKTAALFAASCQAGAILAEPRLIYKDLLAEFGMNFGIAFQMVDDCMDLVGRQKDLGKEPGADLKMGELTLPVLNLISQTRNKEKILALIRQQGSSVALKELRKKFINSPAALKTKEDILVYIRRAKQKLDRLGDSAFKESLLSLTDFVIERVKI